MVIIPIWNNHHSDQDPPADGTLEDFGTRLGMAPEKKQSAVTVEFKAAPSVGSTTIHGLKRKCSNTTGH